MLGQTFAVDETHRKIMLPLMLADFMDRHDARMIEVCRRLGLGVEALDIGVVSKLPRQDHLECDRAVQARLPGGKTTPMPPRAISRMIS